MRVTALPVIEFKLFGCDSEGHTRDEALKNMKSAVSAYIAGTGTDVVIERLEPGPGFVAYANALPGCKAFGMNPDEAARNIRHAIAMCLEAEADEAYQYDGEHEMIYL